MKLSSKQVESIVKAVKEVVNTMIDSVTEHVIIQKMNKKRVHRKKPKNKKNENSPENIRRNKETK